VLLGVAIVAIVLVASFLSTSATTTQLSDAQGNSVGAAEFTEAQDGVHIFLVARELAPGEHGIHIHETGECTPPNFQSADAHFNPGGKHHGLENPEGPHTGDLPNLVASNNGNAVYETIINSVTLTPSGDTSLFHSGGTSLVIHAKADDQMTDPAGNSGDRIACGIVSQ
jgi:Cu-Zn family superoxide dismutase